MAFLLGLMAIPASSDVPAPADPRICDYSFRPVEQAETEWRFSVAKIQVTGGKEPESGGAFLVDAENAIFLTALHVVDGALNGGTITGFMKHEGLSRVIDGLKFSIVPSKREEYTIESKKKIKNDWRHDLALIQLSPDQYVDEQLYRRHRDAIRSLRPFYISFETPPSPLFLTKTSETHMDRPDFKGRETADVAQFAGLLKSLPGTCRGGRCWYLSTDVEARAGDSGAPVFNSNGFVFGPALVHDGDQRAHFAPLRLLADEFSLPNITWDDELEDILTRALDPDVAADVRGRRETLWEILSPNIEPHVSNMRLITLFDSLRDQERLGEIVLDLFVCPVNEALQDRDLLFHFVTLAGEIKVARQIRERAQHESQLTPSEYQQYGETYAKLAREAEFAGARALALRHATRAEQLLRGAAVTKMDEAAQSGRNFAGPVTATLSAFLNEGPLFVDEAARAFSALGLASLTDVSESLKTGRRPPPVPEVLRAAFSREQIALNETWRRLATLPQPAMAEVASDTVANILMQHHDAALLIRRLSDDDALRSLAGRLSATTGRWGVLIAQDDALRRRLLLSSANAAQGLGDYAGAVASIGAAVALQPPAARDAEAFADSYCYPLTRTLNRRLSQAECVAAYRQLDQIEVSRRLADALAGDLRTLNETLAPLGPPLPGSVSPGLDSLPLPLYRSWPSVYGG